MKKDIIRVARVQRADETDLCQAPFLLQFRVLFGEPQSCVGSVRVRIYDPHYTLFYARDDEPTRGIRRHLSQLTLLLESERLWRDGTYFVYLFINDRVYRRGVFELHTPQGKRRTSDGYLDDFDKTSFEYQLATEVCRSNCWYDIERSRLMYDDRQQLMRLLLNFHEVNDAHDVQFGHKPHFFVTGDAEQTLTLTQGIAQVLQAKVREAQRGVVWVPVADVMSELSGLRVCRSLHDKYLVVLDMEMEREAIERSRLGWQWFMEHVLCEDSYRFTMFILRWSKPCMKAWLEVFPDLFRLVHLVSPFRKLLIAESDQYPHAPEEIPSGTEEYSLQPLNELVGLARVKQEVAQAYTMARFAARRSRMNLPAMSDERHHMLFLGNPGTGKTTVAKMLGEIYHDIGLLSSGHTVVVTRSQLVGEYIGKTEAQTTEYIKKARGGILFIDEAYTLVPHDQPSNDFGCEVLHALLPVLSEPHPDLIVILAGYEDKMQQLLQSNQGLHDRFPITLHFDDFTAAELFQMAVQLGAKQGFHFTEAASARLQGLIAQTVAKRDAHFGNGRWVHNLMEQGIVPAMARRVMAMSRRFDEYTLLTRIEEVDVQTAADGWLSEHNEVIAPRRRVGF